ncbi:MAG: type IV pilus assembly protein PilM [Syntrophaceae bacterium]|nr:type IV pilus assembly protein PilM [Syntrophaceae bacterium]
MPETIGLDIGSHSIKLIGLKMTSKGPFLTRLGIKKILPKTDREGTGYLSEALKALLRDVGIKRAKVRLAVSGPGINIQRIAIPHMPKAELKEAVRWEIKARLPFPVETAQIDFHILGEKIEANVKKLDLMVVSCPNPFIDRTLSILQGTGLEPVHLDVEPFALWDALLTWGGIKEEEEIALIDLGAEKTSIHLFRGRTLQFSRVVTPSGTDITRAIMEGIGPAEETDLLYEKAESLKPKVGAPSESTYDKKPQDKSTDLPKINFLVRSVLEKMAGEIGRSLDYYRNQFNVDRIDRILLTGGGAHLRNFSSYLQRELRLPVEHFNPIRGTLFDSKKIDAEMLDQMGSRFTIAAGLALAQPKRIEFLPAEEPFLSKARIIKSIPLLVPLIVLLIFSAMIWRTSGQVASLKRERDAKVAKVKDLETLQAKLTLLKEKEINIKQKLSLFPSSVMVSVPFGEILREVSQLLPENTTLTVLSVQARGKPLKKQIQTSKPKEGESPQDEERELHITGIAFGTDLQCLNALAQIIERLERSPLFKNAKLISADEQKEYNRPGSQFEIVCDIITEKASRL